MAARIRFAAPAARRPFVTRIPLTLAVSEYDHVTDLVTGRVPVEGVDLTCLNLPIEEIFFRAFVYRDFDASEVSMAKLCSMISQGDNSLAAIPVFPSRVPRHSSIYICRGGPVNTPADLKGRKVGLPEWAQTAAVYSRGLLVHQYGVPLDSVEWVQAGVDQPGRTEKVKLNLPAGVKLTPRPDKSLSEMLLSGEIDAIFTAHAPQAAVEGHPDIRRLFEDFLEVEMNYVKETGIFPIMHAVAIRREGRDESVQGLRRSQEPQRNAAASHHLDDGAPALVLRTCTARQGGVRRRSVALRHRRQPQDARRLPAICA
jgi:4,5-dihydroxyphthalate decarboxylase